MSNNAIASRNPSDAGAHGKEATQPKPTHTTIPRFILRLSPVIRPENHSNIPTSPQNVSRYILTSLLIQDGRWLSDDSKVEITCVQDMCEPIHNVLKPNRIIFSNGVAILQRIGNNHNQKSEEEANGQRLRRKPESHSRKSGGSLQISSILANISGVILAGGTFIQRLSVDSSLWGISEFSKQFFRT